MLFDHTESPDISWLKTVLGAMHKVGLEGILVGNAAAVLHGAPVTTQDLDFFVRSTDLVRRRIRQVATELGGVVQELGELTDTLRIEGNFPDLDFLFYIGPFKFESVRRRSSHLLHEKGRVRLAPLEVVIESKEHFGRDKDLAVLPVLRSTLEVLRAMEEAARRPGGA